MPGLKILAHLHVFFTRVFSQISLEFLGLGNIAQVFGNRPEVGQNYAACSTVSATF